MPIRTDLNPGVRPTSTSTSTPAASTAPPPTTEQLMGKMLAGTITRDEAQLLAKMLDTPGQGDGYSAEQRRSVKEFANGRSGPVRNPSELHSNLDLVKNAGELAGRFAADLVLAHPALLEHASLLRAEKATRLFAFAVPYAEAMAQKASDSNELNGAVEKLLREADKAGFASLERQGDGKNGLAALKELLQSAGAQDLSRAAAQMKFDAPSWPTETVRPPTDREHLQPTSPLKQGDAQVLRPLPAVMQPPVPIERKAQAQAEASQRSSEGTHKKLGAAMLWNVLHRYRDSGEEGQESAAQRDAMNQLAVAAGLILLFMAIVVGVLVAL